MKQIKQMKQHPTNIDIDACSRSLSIVCKQKDIYIAIAVIAHDHIGYCMSDGLWLYIQNTFDIDYVNNANYT